MKPDRCLQGISLMAQGFLPRDFHSLRKISSVKSGDIYFHQTFTVMKNILFYLFACFLCVPCIILVLSGDLSSGLIGCAYGAILLIFLPKSFWQRFIRLSVRYTDKIFGTEKAAG